MAAALVNFSLPAILLVSVVIAGPPNFNTTNPTEIRSLNLSENRDVSINASEDVEVINSTPTPTSAPSTLPEGYVRFPDLHSAYKLYTAYPTWDEARNSCIAEGAHLAITDTHEKIERILAMEGVYRNNQIHVGIQKSNTTDDWVRVDNGLPLASIPWSGHQGIYDDPRCSILLFGWNEGVYITHCAWKAWYVCEIPI